MKTKPTTYTEEFVKNELENLLKETMENKELVVMGELFEGKDYSQERFSEWAKNFKDNEEISQSIKKIKNIFENRVNVGGLKNKLNATMAIFNLKNNYGWKDKTESDITTGGEKIIPILNGLSSNNSNKKDSKPPTED
jgi:hypothetical protein